MKAPALSLFVLTRILLLQESVVEATVEMSDELKHEFFKRNNVRRTRFETESAIGEFGNNNNNQVATPKIIGGQDAEPGDYPFFVQGFGCGASLIWKDIVLTAGHCIGYMGNRVLVGGTIEKDVPVSMEWYGCEGSASKTIAIHLTISFQIDRTKTANGSTSKKSLDTPTM